MNDEQRTSEPPANVLTCADTSAVASDRIGGIIGPYKLLQQIGEGGFWKIGQQEVTAGFDGGRVGLGTGGGASTETARALPFPFVLVGRAKLRGCRSRKQRTSR